MAKPTLKLSGNYPAWAPGVRTGKLVRVNGMETAILVRVEDAEATPERLAFRREEARVLARASNAGLLRLEQVVPVGGKVARVYEACDGASLVRIREVVAARGESVSPRVALGIAAAVGHALDASLGVAEGERALVAPPSMLADVLVEPGGRVRLAAMDTAPLASPRAALSARAVAILFVETLTGRLLGTEPTDLEVALARVASAGGNAELGRVLGEVLLMGQAGTPGALARTFDRLAAEHVGPSVGAWAPGVVSAALRAAIGAAPALPETQTGVHLRAPSVRNRSTPAPERGLPLPDASRPFERGPGGRLLAAGRVQLEDADVDPPTTISRARVTASLDALVNDVDEAEATVVGIARMADPEAAVERDPFDMTSNFRPAAPEGIRPAQVATASGGNRMIPVLVAVAGALLVVAVAVMAFRGESPPAASTALEPPAPSEPVALPREVMKSAAPEVVAPGAASAPSKAACAETSTARAEPSGKRAAETRPTAAVTTASAPATSAAPVAAAPATPATVRVSFRSADPAIVELDVECVGGRGKGPTVAIASTPPGNCRVTGRTAEGARLAVMLPVQASGDFACFEGGVRACR